MIKNKLKRNLGIVTLTATGICSMLGASIHVVPFMIQRNVPGIGPYVLPAFIFAMIPAFFAALAYGILSSAMPRAGGSYIYASRGLNPYLGFIASFFSMVRLIHSDWCDFIYLRFIYSRCPFRFGLA